MDTPQAPHPATTHPGIGPTELGSRVQLFWLLVLGGLLTGSLQLPFRLGSAVLCLAAIWVGAVVLARLSRARRLAMYQAVISGARHTRGRRSWPIGLGVGLAAVLLLNTAAEAALYPLVADRDRCFAEANTQQAGEACLQQSEQRLRRLVEDLTGTTLPTTGG